MDVKISVISWIIEITRITTPDALYKDEQMKEIFQLIVAACEKVKLCLVMLDLECDALVVEMFKVP